MAELPPRSALPAPPFLTEPLFDLAAWTRHFRDAEIPVLAATADALEDLRAREDDVDAAMIAAVVQADPLMVVKLLAHAATRRSAEHATETETVTSALVMMGIGPFFRHFGPQPTLEDWLHDQPQALDGMRALLLRAERAQRFALGFSVHRGDPDAEVIQQAAFLHDFAEMLVWCHAPALMLRVHSAQLADPDLRSASTQLSVLHVELDDLAQALMKLWHLPALLVRISDAKHADQADVLSAVLAVRLARHTMQGWDNPALPDDVEAIAGLLNAAPRVVLAFLHKIDMAVEPGPAPAG